MTSRRLTETRHSTSISIYSIPGTGVPKGSILPCPTLPRVQSSTSVPSPFRGPPPSYSEFPICQPRPTVRPSVFEVTTVSNTTFLLITIVLTEPAPVLIFLRSETVRFNTLELDQWRQRSR